VTRAARYDGRSVRASVIPGIRLEAETAQRLVDAACSIAPAPPKKHGLGCGDVGATVRHFIRVGLGMPLRESVRVAACGIAGLHLDSDTCERLTAYADEIGLNKAGAVRHLIRLGLGIDDEASLERERYFAELADAHKSRGDLGAARFNGAE
jgi:hypothetical protein